MKIQWIFILFHTDWVVFRFVWFILHRSKYDLYLVKSRLLIFFSGHDQCEFCFFLFWLHVLSSQIQSRPFFGEIIAENNEVIHGHQNISTDFCSKIWHSRELKLLKLHIQVVVVFFLKLIHFILNWWKMQIFSDAYSISFCSVLLLFVTVWIRAFSK